MRRILVLLGLIGLGVLVGFGIRLLLPRSRGRPARHRGAQNRVRAVAKPSATES